MYASIALRPSPAASVAYWALGWTLLLARALGPPLLARWSGERRPVPCFAVAVPCRGFKVSERRLGRARAAARRTLRSCLCVGMMPAGCAPCRLSSAPCRGWLTWLGARRPAPSALRPGSFGLARHSAWHSKSVARIRCPPPLWLAAGAPGRPRSLLACHHSRPELRQDDPLNLSILISGGKENKSDALSNGE